MDVVLFVIRLALAAVFGLAALGKLKDQGGTRKSVVEFGAPPRMAGAIAVALPVAELACVIALLPAGWAVWGAGGILAMLVVFSAAMVVNLAQGKRPACHCFGQLHSTPIGASTLVRNGVLMAMAGLVIWRGPQNPRMGEVWMRLGESPVVVPALITAVAALAVFQLWMLLALLKQNGRILLRLEAVEKRLKMDPASRARGLSVGKPAPSFELTGLDGNTVTLERLSGESKPLLLVFVEPGCGPCEALLPDVAEWQKQYDDRLKIAVITHGGRRVNAGLAAKYHLSNLLLQEDRETAEEYLISGTPAAILVKGGRIASRPAEGADAIRSLVVRSTLPPAAGIGERLPSYELPELGGGMADLSSLRGRRRILLLWDPDCGFCKAVTEEVKAWEKRRTDDMPELVIVSAGSPEAVRSLGFQSRVLLDPHFAVGTLVKAKGTPSAVLLDEEGQVASEVGAGIAGVFELLGTVPYVPTDEEVADAMLKLAGTGREDLVYDLGCGDGRIVVTAAKKYKARGVGIDLNPDLIRQARERARKARVQNRVRFEQQDLLSADIHAATVVTLYLLPGLLGPLQSKLKDELAPGTRIVSHDFPLDGWEADREVKLEGATLYLYTVPERV